MQGSTVLIVIGIVMILLGVPLIVLAEKYADWEAKEYNKAVKKDAPKHLKEGTLVVGSVVTGLGCLLVVWGMMHHHKGALPKHMKLK